MRVSRAVELLINPLNLEVVKRFPEFTTAIKLGAEALKRIDAVRKWGTIQDTLIGETLEEE